MSFVVPDASVAVEYLLRTDLGVRIAPRLDAAALVAPGLLDVEVLSVLRRAVLSGRLSERRAAEAVSDLGEWEFERVSHRRLLAEAWSLRPNFTAYDAVYVAVAIRFGATLLTADGPLARAPLRGAVVENVRGPR